MCGVVSLECHIVFYCVSLSILFQVEGRERVDAGGRIDGDGDHGGGGSSIWSTGKKNHFQFYFFKGK